MMRPRDDDDDNNDDDGSFSYTSPSESLSKATSWLDGYSEMGDDYRHDRRAKSDDANDINNKDDGDDVSSSPSSSNTHPVEDAIRLLSTLHDRMYNIDGLISDNELFDDVPTSTLLLLDVKYQLGRAYLMLPVNLMTNDASTTMTGGGGGGPSLLRRHNVSKAIEHYTSFLNQLVRLGEGMLEDATLVECRELLDVDEDGGGGDDDDDDDDDDDVHSDRIPPSASSSFGRIGNRRTRNKVDSSKVREMKIRRYQRKRIMEIRMDRMSSQLSRRARLRISEEEVLDGYDNETLLRTLYVETLRMHAEICLEEIHSSYAELDMIDMSLNLSTKIGGASDGWDPRMNGRSASGTSRGGGSSDERQPLHMTQIMQNPMTGQLELIKKRVSTDGRLVPVQYAPNATTSMTPSNVVMRDAMSSMVFRPSWNQPTMTLEELGDKERADAMRRSEEQRIAEADAMYRPRRYDQLERDGMEDDEYLVEASAKLDRDWDDWKDENPRGSGNKMGDRGDRNF